MAQDYTKLGIAEFLKEASKQDGRNARINFLREHSTPALKTILGYTYDPNIEWLLPEGDPPYKPADKAVLLISLSVTELPSGVKNPPDSSK